MTILRNNFSLFEFFQQKLPFIIWVEAYLGRWIKWENFVSQTKYYYQIWWLMAKREKRIFTRSKKEYYFGGEIYFLKNEALIGAKEFHSNLLLPLVITTRNLKKTKMSLLSSLFLVCKNKDDILCCSRSNKLHVSVAVWLIGNFIIISI